MVDNRIKFAFPISYVKNDISENDTYIVPKDTQILIIPQGYKSIGSSAFSEMNIEEVILPDTITSIGDYAFCKCKNLKKMNLPNSVTEIGEFAFAGSGLLNISIPDSVTRVSDAAFAKCINLRLVSILSERVFFGEGVFFECCHLQTVRFANGVNKISSGMFEKCTSLKEIELPKSISSIGDSAFRLCTNLEKVVIYGDVKEIMQYAFSDCNSLKTMKFTYNPPKMHYTVFENTPYNIKKHYKCTVFGKKRAQFGDFIENTLYPKLLNAKSMIEKLAMEDAERCQNLVADKLKQANRIVNNPSDYSAEQVEKAKAFIEKCENEGW